VDNGSSVGGVNSTGFRAVRLIKWFFRLT
jgi:hypothetical protein